MLPNFKLDPVALEQDPNLADLAFDPGPQSTVFHTNIGQQIFALLSSRIGVAMLIGAVASAPSRPPVVGVEPLLNAQLGDAAFEDNYKRLIGRITRFILEHVGMEHDTRGVKVAKNLPSHFSSGSTYKFRQSVWS